MIGDSYVYVEMHVPACESCHREANQVDYIRLLTDSKEMLSAAGLDTSWPAWEERTPEDVARQFDKVAEVLNSDYLKFSGLLDDRRYSSETYAHSVHSLRHFAELCRQYPNGVVKVAVTGQPTT